MKVKIEYDYKADNSYPYKAKASIDGLSVSVGSSKVSFEDAKTEALEIAKSKEVNVTIPEPEEAEL